MSCRVTEEGQFEQGEVFEFDCDTDGGLGAGGDDMRGLVVTVVFDAGSFEVVDTRELAKDFGAVNRSFAVVGN